MTPEELKELESFLKGTIPIVRENPKTFLGISKQPHYENVWSNIYAFFFNPKEEHNLEDLFIKSLIQLVPQKEGFSFDTTNCKPEREFLTKRGGRIDLLLSDLNSTIIIENKVYHHSESNDFVDYWESANNPQLGIILSLKKNHKMPNENYINITHLELMNSVMANIGTHFSKANEKYLVFLKDFHQNIMNMTNPVEEAIIKFYRENVKEIEQVNKVRNKYFGHILSQTEEAMDDIKKGEFKYVFKKENRFCYYSCNKQKNLMITVDFKGLFNNSREMLIIVELQNALLEKKHREIIESISFDNSELSVLKDNYYNPVSFWAHFAIQKCTLADDEIVNLREYIAKKINEGPILSIYNKLKKALVDQK